MPQMYGWAGSNSRADLLLLLLLLPVPPLWLNAMGNAGVAHMVQCVLWCILVPRLSRRGGMQWATCRVRQSAGSAAADGKAYFI
jgi:hypothetical protein